MILKLVISRITFPPASFLILNLEKIVLYSFMTRKISILYSTLTYLFLFINFKFLTLKKKHPNFKF